jgi:hypothetical protein
MRYTNETGKSLSVPSEHMADLTPREVIEVEHQGSK